MPNFQNQRKKDKKYNKDKEATRIVKKDFEEQLIKFKDIIDVQQTHAKDHMDHKDL